MSRTFSISFGLSVVAHILFFLVALFGADLLGRTPSPQPDVLEVAFVEDIAEEQAVEEEQPEPEPEQEQEPEPEPITQPEEIEVPQPQPDDVLPDPAPEVPEEAPEPEPEAPVEEPAEPEPVTTVARTVEPQPKPAPPEPEPQLDLDQLAALIDKEAEKTVVDPLADVAEQLEEAAAKQEAIERVRRRNLATIQDYLRRKVQGCWSIPAGAKDARDLTVILRIDLRPNGQLSRAPRTVDAGNLSAPGQEFKRIFAESAIRAIQRCAPYKIPVDDYDQWKAIEFVFDARALLGG